MYKKIAILLIVLLSLTSCTIKQEDGFDNDSIKKEIDYDISGNVELLTRNPVEEDGFVEFDISILASQKEAEQRMIIFVDSVIAPFSVDGNEIKDYFDINADGIANVYKIKVDVSNIENNSNSKISISRISIPGEGVSMEYNSTKMQYFAGSVFDFSFSNSNGVNTPNKFTNLRPQLLEDISSNLYEQIIEYLEVSHDFDYFFTITSQYELVVPNPVTKSPNLIFYSTSKESQDYVIYLFNSGELVSTEGLAFRLDEGEAIDLPLDVYNLQNSTVSLLIFRNGRIDDTALAPTILK